MLIVPPGAPFFRSEEMSNNYVDDSHAKYNDGELSPKEEKRHWKRLELEEEAREERRAERQAELRERYWENE